MAITERVSIVRISERAVEDTCDFVVSEKIIHVFINKQYVFYACITNAHIREFLIGRLVTECYIRSPKDILSIDDLGNRIDITLTTKFDASEATFEHVAKLISFSCASTGNVESAAGEGIIRSKATYDIKVLLSLMEEFQRKSLVFQQTGGIHSCALSDGMLFLFFTEDIGRYNAVDKAIGYFFDNCMDKQNVLLFTSGRISAELIFKTLRAGIDGVVSKSAPTHEAILAARRNALLLIGFVRGDRCNIYNGSEKVCL